MSIDSFSNELHRIYNPTIMFYFSINQKIILITNAKNNLNKIVLNNQFLELKYIFYILFRCHIDFQKKIT